MFATFYSVAPLAAALLLVQVARGKELPLKGETFLVSEQTAFIIPSQLDPGATFKPWVWYAPTLPGLPGKEEQWMFERFISAGIAIAGIDAGESYGSPDGNNLFTEFYRQMISRGYGPKPVFLGRSRGGLMALSWALQNPNKIGAFAGIYPVCNLASYPGVDKAATAYRLSPEKLRAELPNYNPVDRLRELAALARAGVPFFAIHGDADKVVPLDTNSGLFKERFEAAGGSMELIVPPGQGHNFWTGFFQCEELVHFVTAHAVPVLNVISPVDYQVVQRRSKLKGRLAISGTFRNLGHKQAIIEARIVANDTAGPWHRLSLDAKCGTFKGNFTAPSGGWYRLEVRARIRNATLTLATVEHVGLGEVFVVAGQSNSANHGEEKQRTMTGWVSAFDGTHWQLANDPQPGASGNGGSFMPLFGDTIAERAGVPVGIVACGVGATSVREWLPAGVKFPSPPTLTGNVRQLPNGEWESKGTLYTSLCVRMRVLGPRGLRAILWHQGESDANQPDPARTLPGNLYRAYMERLIRASRMAARWKVPWFVAQASYHVPGDESSPEIRAAQASLWQSGLAQEGPDTDALKGEMRDNHGQGVHFSGPGLRQHGALWAEKVGPWLDKSVH